MKYTEEQIKDVLNQVLSMLSAEGMRYWECDVVEDAIEAAFGFKLTEA